MIDEDRPQVGQRVAKHLDFDMVPKRASWPHALAFVQIVSDCFVPLVSTPSKGPLEQHCVFKQLYEQQLPEHKRTSPCESCCILRRYTQCTRIPMRATRFPL